MQNWKTIQKLLDRIQYKKGWTFNLDIRADCYTVQCIFLGPDNETGDMSQQKCRKWIISKYMTDNEVVRTVYTAIRIAEEHEMNELFKFDGQTVANPHINIIDLSQGKIDLENLDKRTEIEKV